MSRNNRHVARSSIAFISFQVLNVTGSRTSLLGIGEKLTESGNQVDFLGVGSTGVLESRDKNMRLVAVPMKALPFVTHVFYLTLLVLILPFYIAVRQPNFVVLEPKFGSVILALEFRLFLARLRPKIILDIRSPPVEVNSFRRYLGALAFNASVIAATKVSDGITFATDRMKEEVCAKFRLSSKLIQVWHNGVDVDLFRPQKFRGEETRKRLGLSDEFVVFYHGVFRQNGGIAETIRSIQILKNSCPNIVLFLLGSGPVLQLYKNLIREIGIEDRVFIHEPVCYSDVPKYIAMADVGIVPLPDTSDWRNQSPLKLIEYLAMAKTVIATDIPANRELIGEERCGIYTSAASPEAIAGAILYAYNNREKLGEWGASGRDIVKEEYDWKTVAQNFEKHLHELRKS